MYRAVKSFPLPPGRISPGGVHGDLEATGQCFAKLIAGHKQSLAVSCTSGMKCGLLWIWSVMPKTVFDQAPTLLVEDSPL
jgi:hypothetical protein